MPTQGELFNGCTVALVTPFKGDDEVDLDALGGLVDWHVEQGTHAISPVGTTGESPTLSHEEHERVIETVVQRAAGRARVMAGTGSNATSEAVRLTKFAQRAGADGALLVAPYYNRPSQEGLYAHYARISEASDLPLVLYNVPGRTARNIEPATVERLSRVARIVAIKEASGSLDQVSEIRMRTDLTILSGDDSLTLPMLAVGAGGVVSVAANLVPRQVMAMIAAFEQGDLEGARRRHLELFPLCRDLLSIAANPIPVKAAMGLLGRIDGRMRLPLCPPDEAGLMTLRSSLRRHGLLGD
ncbi:4-hydroxy-tetrahydrodipicolinate synthase [Tautonia plasticadhaerens]|uniref:4-hydroxy-tetrahydrodipicolinate synthase n=1 Tax=Tautonia plasticadhaerens TaxID=2527974 RepID=A0A518H8X5_9BACT|nr:4-hydroxy-tetrahydrodipicolinate synthase [Tautonia plasticadhaerens]